VRHCTVVVTGALGQPEAPVLKVAVTTAPGNISNPLNPLSSQVPDAVVATGGYTEPSTFSVTS
jgi:hypothetical protein